MAESSFCCKKSSAINGSQVTLLMGIAVGNQTILQTTDGGLTWDSITNWSSSGIMLNALKFANDKVGVAIGFNNQGSPSIFKTEDAGQSWFPTSLFGTGVGELSSIDLFKNQVIVAGVGDIIGSDDTGNNWNFIYPSQTTYSLYGITFINDTRAIAVGSYNFSRTGILKTNSLFLDEPDIINWTGVDVSNITTDVLYDIQLVGGGTAVAVGYQGVILRTTDTGSTWSLISSNTNKSLRRASFYNSVQGIIVGDSGTVLLTNNGGLSWDNKSIKTNTCLYAVGYSNDLVIVTVGNDGKIFRTNNQCDSWQQIRTKYSSDLRGFMFLPL